MTDEASWEMRARTAETLLEDERADNEHLRAYIKELEAKLDAVEKKAGQSNPKPLKVNPPLHQLFNEFDMAEMMDLLRPPSRYRRKNGELSIAQGDSHSTVQEGPGGLRYRVEIIHGTRRTHTLRHILYSSNEKDARFEHASSDKPSTQRAYNIATDMLMRLGRRTGHSETMWLAEMIFFAARS